MATPRAPGTPGRPQSARQNSARSPGGGLGDKRKSRADLLAFHHQASTGGGSSSATSFPASGLRWVSRGRTKPAEGFELIDAAAGLTLRGAPVGEFEVTGAGALMGFAERWVPQLATAIEVAADPARAAEVAEERGRMRAATQIEIGADADDDDGGDGMLPPRVPMPVSYTHLTLPTKA